MKTVASRMVELRESHDTNRSEMAKLLGFVDILC